VPRLRNDAASRTRGLDGGTMTQHGTEALIFQRGDVKALPDTLSGTRHLTLALIDIDASAGSATFELHNPEAQPDAMVGDLIEERLEDVVAANERRDKLHLPEKAVSVDTATMPIETLHCRLHEKLQVGDRLWTVTDIGADRVTLTPGHDHETHTLVNEVEDLEYGPAGIAIAEKLNGIDEAL
jgi:hypothetical protein